MVAMAMSFLFEAQRSRMPSAASAAVTVAICRRERDPRRTFSGHQDTDFYTYLEGRIFGQCFCVRDWHILIPSDESRNHTTINNAMALAGPPAN
jgi:hypothetical protein